MKISLSTRSILLAGAFVVSSCATTNQYSEDVTKNNYSNLEAGRTYKFQLKDSAKSQKMVFSTVKNDSIIGYTNQKDARRVALAKSNVVSAKNMKNATLKTVAIGIGVVGAAAIILSTTRATSN